MLGNQIANRSPFVRPREISPTASWSTWKITTGIIYVCNGFLRLQSSWLKKLVCKAWSASREIRRASLAPCHTLQWCAKKAFFAFPFLVSLSVFTLVPDLSFDCLCALDLRGLGQSPIMACQKTSAREAADFRSTTPVYSSALLTSLVFLGVVETNVDLLLCFIVGLVSFQAFLSRHWLLLRHLCNGHPSTTAIFLSQGGRCRELQLHILTSCLNSEKVARSPSSQKTYASLSGNLSTTLSNLSPIVSPSRSLVEVPWE